LQELEKSMIYLAISFAKYQAARRINGLLFILLGLTNLAANLQTATGQSKTVMSQVRPALFFPFIFLRETIFHFLPVCNLDVLYTSSLSARRLESSWCPFDSKEQQRNLHDKQYDRRRVFALVPCWCHHVPA
jgi:hypothetical protein